MAEELVQNTEIKDQLKQEIEHDCAKLKSFLEAAQIINEISPRSRDIIIGVGEKLSCRIVAAVLQDRVRRKSNFYMGITCTKHGIIRMWMLHLFHWRISLIVNLKCLINAFTTTCLNVWLKRSRNVVTRSQLSLVSIEIHVFMYLNSSCFNNRLLWYCSW